MTRAPRRRVSLTLALAASVLAVVAWLAGSTPIAAASRPADHNSTPGSGQERPTCEARSLGSKAATTVAVLVVFPDGKRDTACVAPGGTGVDVLRRAGFDPVVSSYGSVGGRVALCALTHPGTGEQVGCAAGPGCLTCQAPDYWGYFPGYRFAAVGAGSTTPRAGTVEAWRWGESQRWSGSAPSATTLCGPADPPPPPATPPTTTRPPSTTQPSTGGSGGTGGSGAAGPGHQGTGTGGGGGNGGTSTGSGGTPGGGGDGAHGATTTPGGGGQGTADPAAEGKAGSDEDAPSGNPSDKRAGDKGDGDGTDDQATGVPASTRTASPSSGGGPDGLAAFALTAAIVGAIAALAVRARRRRALLEPAEDA